MADLSIVMAQIGDITQPQNPWITKSWGVSPVTINFSDFPLTIQLLGYPVMETWQASKMDLAHYSRISTIIKQLKKTFLR
jgi:hypothetical protein